MKTWVVLLAVVMTAGSAWAQVPTPAEEAQIRARQRMSTMEAVFASAVSNGADNVLRQVSSVSPDRPTLSGITQVQGLRLEGYGAVFYVRVPQMILPILWPYRQVISESQVRNADRARMQLQQIRRAAAGLPPDEAARLQAIVRDLEVQLSESPAVLMTAPGRVSAATVGAQPPPQPNVDPAIVEDPQAVYTREVKSQLITAMLENSQSLGLGAQEWLTVAARDDEPRNPLFPSGATVDSSTWIARVKGSDLAALRAGTLTLEEARKRVEIKED